MSSTYIPTTLRRLVEKRANYRCEYCLIPAFVVFFPHEIDHVIAKKHGGETDENNLRREFKEAFFALIYMGAYYSHYNILI